MKLEQIGFYTLSDYRAEHATDKTPLWRCELVLTDKCNFKCPYCRGMRSDISGSMPFDTASQVLNYWIKESLKNVRFSGGEPTLYPKLTELVEIAKKGKVEHIAVSTNGSAPIKLYEKLIASGVNDFSISLDSCCSSEGDKMAGGIYGAWEKVCETIGVLSKKTYTTVGIVINEQNISNCVNTVLFADTLGVKDIRVIPSAQYDEQLSCLSKLPKEVLKKHPILNYRVNNFQSNRHVRGINGSDSNKCWLALDDMAVAGKYHFPCIIYLREQGNPIGEIGVKMRKERKNWVLNHNVKNDPICKKNCLDVCVDYCNKVESYRVRQC